MRKAMTTIKLKDHKKLKPAHDFVTKYPDAVIAGGVARDILLGREYNDIDIFMPEPLIRTASYTLHETIRNMDGCKVHDDTYSGHGSRYIVGDLDFTILPRNIMNSISKLVEQFDMVMSQAWLEPTSDGFEVCSTNLFDQYNKSKILGYYPDLVKGESDHVQRVYKSFKNHLLVALAPKDSVPIIHDPEALPF